MQRSGIYCIINRKNNKRYVGQSVHLSTRINEHFIALKHNYHANKSMQRDYNKDAAYFAWEILEFVPVADLAAREKYWCDFYHTFDHARGYNHQPIYNRTYVKNIHKFDGNN